jgi:hypothetical protein
MPKPLKQTGASRRTARLRMGDLDARLSGKAMMMMNMRGPAEQARFMAARRAWREQADDEFRVKRDELLGAIAPYRALALLGHVYFKETVANPETYKEWQHEGVAAKVEHFALLLLARDHDGIERLVPETIVSAIHEYLELIFTALPAYHSDVAEGKTHLDPDPRSLVLMWELGIRMPLYMWQHRATLRQLFGPTTSWMHDRLGFSIDDALEIEIAFERLVNGVLARELPRFTAGMSELARVMEFVPGGAFPKPGYETEATAMWTSFQLRWSESMSRIGENVALTTAELAAEASLDPARVDAVLHFFTLTRNELPRDYYIPIPASPLKFKPIVTFNERWTLPSSMLMLPAIQPALERALNPAFKLPTAEMNDWNIYEKGRSEILEARASIALSKLLDGAKVYRNVKYKVSGQKQPYELDALAIVDGTLLLLECKGGAFSSAAKRGDPAAIEERISSLVTDAHKQAVRALQYIESQDTPTFRNAADTIVIDKSHITQTFLLAVTLEELGYLTASFNEVDRLKSKASAGTPWIVPLHDLELVAKYVTSGVEFIHYLQRRIAMNAQPQMRAVDELDWLGRYFYDGLTFAEVRDVLTAGSTASVSLASHKTAFDDFEHYENGVRLTPAPRPQSTIHPMIRLFVSELTKWSRRGYIDAGVAVLDLPRKLQRSFAKRIGRAMQRVRRTECIDEAAVTADGRIVLFVTVCGALVEAHRIEDLLNPTMGKINVHVIVDAHCRVLDVRVSAPTESV